MDADYRIRLTRARRQLLRAHVESHRDGAVDFDATLALERRELAALAAAHAIPFMTRAWWPASTSQALDCA